jgi:hypothetical protein
MSWLRANRVTRAAFYVSIIDIFQEDPYTSSLLIFSNRTLFLFLPLRYMSFTMSGAFCGASRALARAEP